MKSVFTSAARRTRLHGGTPKVGAAAGERNTLFIMPWGGAPDARDASAS
jgi:hypothetical protein